MKQSKPPGKRPKLQMLGSRVPVLDTRTAKPLEARRTGKAFGDSDPAGLRLRGRARQARNERIKLRDRYTCQRCRCVTELGHVDHIVPLSDGGSDEDSNLQWLCAVGETGGCHGEKTREEQAARARG